MLSYSLSALALVIAILALESSKDWKNWLWSRLVWWQWHTLEIILPLPLLDILIGLLIQPTFDLVLVAQMAADGSWRECLLATSDMTHQNEIFGIYRNPLPQCLGQWQWQLH